MLSDIEIFAITAPHLPSLGHADIWATKPEYAEAVGIDKGVRWIVQEMTPENTLAASRAIEAEVRKQDTALIRQLVDALDEATTYTASAMWSPSMTNECKELVAKGRARLEGKP